MNRPALLLAALCAGSHLPAAAQEDAQDDQPRGKIVVGSKNFAENRLLGELFAQLIEARTDLEVERNSGSPAPSSSSATTACRAWPGSTASTSAASSPCCRRPTTRQPRPGRSM